jgi:hypothetical protein
MHNTVFARRLIRTGTSRESGGQRRKRKRRKVPSWTGQKSTKVKKTTLFSELPIWIRIIFGSWIWFRITEAWDAKIEPWRGWGLSQWRRGGSKWSPGGSVDQWTQIRITH